MRVIRYLVVILIMFFIASIWFIMSSYQRERRSDFKLGVAADDGLALISVSWERQMVNILLIEKTTEVWIPGGLGWYVSGKVKKLLDLEKKWEMLGKVLFFNYGFVADKTIKLERVSGWDKGEVLLKEMGLLKWIKFKLNLGQMVRKVEIVDNEMSEETLDEIMVRDFSDSSLANDETKIEVINQTKEDGLAGFIGNKLERVGMLVVGIENAKEESARGCLWVYPKQPEKFLSSEIMRNMFGCEEKEDENLNRSEWELYLGEDWAKMIKYSSYVRSF